MFPYGVPRITEEERAALLILGNLRGFFVPYLNRHKEVYQYGQYSIVVLNEKYDKTTGPNAQTICTIVT